MSLFPSRYPNTRASLVTLLYRAIRLKASPKVCEDAFSSFVKTARRQTGGQKKSNFGFPMARRYNFPIHKTCTPISTISFDGRSARRALRTIRSTWDSLGFDVGCPDQRPPLLDLGLVERGERLRGLLLAGWYLLAEIDQAPAHGRIGQRIHGGGRQPVDDVGWRALRHPHAVPGRDVHPGCAGLVHGRDVGRRSQPGAGSYGIRFNGAVPHGGERRDRLIESQVNVAGDQIAHDIGRAGSVRHEPETGAGDVLKIDAADMLSAARPGGALGRVRIGVEPGDQLLEILRRQVLARDDDVGVAGQPRDRLQILQYVVL